MKTDRELLEAAAKAAGMVPADEIDSHIPSGGMWVVGRGGRDAIFDPLRDDGDAFRLAVKLNLTCRFYFGNTCAQATAPGMPRAYEDVHNPADPLAGARLAIVRAAAAMAG
jgi:hypothetical protein